MLSATSFLLFGKKTQQIVWKSTLANLGSFRQSSGLWVIRSREKSRMLFIGFILVCIILLCPLVCAQWPFAFGDFHRWRTVECLAATSTQSYLLDKTNVTMIISLPGEFILRTTHLISWTLTLPFFTSEDRSAVGMWACCQRSTLASENHRDFRHRVKRSDTCSSYCTALGQVD